MKMRCTHNEIGALKGKAEPYLSYGTEIQITISEHINWQAPAAVEYFDRFQDLLEELAGYGYHIEHYRDTERRQCTLFLSTPPGD